MRWSEPHYLAEGWPGQRVLITGASGGIGQALVDELAAAGAQLLVTGRDAETLERLCRLHPGQITAQPADLTRAEDRTRLVAVAERLECTMLINAAGANRAELFKDSDDEAIERLVAINLTATLQLTRAMLPQLCRAEQGLVVNLGSAFGHIGYPGQATYCATKFALYGFTQALRRELADSPIAVHYIAPRATRTAMNAPAMEEMNEALGNAMDDPETVATQIRRAIERGRKETRLGRVEPIFARLNALWPGLIDRALRRQLPTIRRFIAPPNGHAP